MPRALLDVAHADRCAEAAPSAVAVAAVHVANCFFRDVFDTPCTSSSFRSALERRRSQTVENKRSGQKVSVLFVFRFCSAFSVRSAGVFSGSLPSSSRISFRARFCFVHLGSVHRVTTAESSGTGSLMCDNQTQSKSPPRSPPQFQFLQQKKAGSISSTVLVPHCRYA